MTKHILDDGQSDRPVYRNRRTGAVWVNTGHRPPFWIFGHDREQHRVTGRESEAEMELDQWTFETILARRKQAQKNGNPERLNDLVLGPCRRNRPKS